jgi:hypothetical protein
MGSYNLMQRFPRRSGAVATHRRRSLCGCFDPALAQLNPQEALSDPWPIRAERLLSLPGDYDRFSVVRLARC